MADPQGGQVAQLSRAIETTTGKLQDVSTQLQIYANDQRHLQEDIRQIRQLMETMDQLMNRGNPSFNTRLTMVETDVKDIKDERARSRDWWLKLVASLSATLIVGVLGLLLYLYANTKGALVVKP